MGNHLNFCSQSDWGESNRISFWGESECKNKGELKPRTKAKLLYGSLSLTDTFRLRLLEEGGKDGGKIPVQRTMIYSEPCLFNPLKSTLWQICSTQTWNIGGWLIYLVHSYMYITRSLGARWAPTSSCGPSGRLLALRACLTSSFAPFGRSGRVTHATLR